MTFSKIFGLFLLAPSASAAINWGECPPGQIDPSVANTWDCATLEFDIDRNNPDLGKATSFVRRGYPKGKSPSTKSVWGIAGGPGISTKSFVFMFDYFESYDPSLTSYLVDARGIGLSWPMKNCAKVPPYLNPYNDTLMDIQDACNKEILDADRERLPYITTYHAALDLQGVMDAVKADGLAETISILAVSYGTFFANTLLQLPGLEVDVVIYDGGISATRWPIENNAPMQSMSAYDAIRMCVSESSVCKKELSDLGHLPLMTKDAIVDGILPCQSKLSWLREIDGNYFTSLHNNFFNPNDKRALLGPFWARLWRCSDSDVEQLNFFHNKRLSQLESNPTTVDPSEFSTGYQTNVGSSDIFSYSANPLTYDQIIDYNERHFTVEAGDMVSGFARDVSEWPAPVPHVSTRTYASPTAPVHIFVGTLDANTPVGQAYWIKQYYSNTTDVSIHIVPYASHGIAGPTNFCANDIFADILSLKTNVDTSCLATSVPVPDWDGSDDYTRNELSKVWFNTPDLWNNGYLVDDASTDITSTDDCEWSSKDVVNVTLYVAVPMGITIVALVSFIVFKFMGSPTDKKLMYSDNL